MKRIIVKIYKCIFNHFLFVMDADDFISFILVTSLTFIEYIKVKLNQYLSSVLNCYLKM